MLYPAHRPNQTLRPHLFLVREEQPEYGREAARERGEVARDARPATDSPERKAELDEIEDLGD